MAKGNDYVNVFDLEGSYAGGGEFFKDGRYGVVESFYAMFDFMGKAKKGEEATALCLELQPKDEDGEDVGKPVIQWWPIRGDGVELANPIKGKKGAFASLILTGDYDTLMRGGEFYVFMDHLRKAEFDMDSYDNDITVFEGQDWLMGKTPDTYEKAGGDDKKKKARMIVVVTDANAGGAKKSRSAKGSGGSPSPKNDAGSKKASKSKVKPEDMDAEQLLSKYIEDELAGAKNPEETTRPILRMDIGKWITGPLDLAAEQARAVQKLVNDDNALTAALKQFGWTMEDKTISPPKE